MLSVIMGKSKAVAEPMPSNLLVVGGSFTGRLKIYDRDTLQEVTGVDTSIFTAVYGVAGDANYIYAGGSTSIEPSIRKISRANKVTSPASISNLLNTTQNICVDGTYLFYTSNSNTRDVGRITLSTGSDIYILATTGTASALCQTTSNIYFSFTSGTVNYIRAYTKARVSIKSIVTTTAPQRNGITADESFVYFGSATSGDFHVYNLALTAEQTGYPTIPGGIYSILNDDTNVYVGSNGGNIYIINKATKALTTTTTGLGTDIISLSQTSNLLYASSASGVVKIGKSNLSTVYSVLSGLSSINTIMVI